MSKMTTLAWLAKKAVRSSKDATELIEAAGAVVAAASILLKEAETVLDGVDTEALVGKLQSGAKVAAEGASKAGGAVKGAAGGAAGAMRGAAGGAAVAVNDILSKLGDAREGISADLSDAKTAKELRKTIKEARQSVLENATIKISVNDLQKALDKSGSALVGPINDMPGCIVIATYKKFDFDNDLTDYTGIYVDKADDAAAGVLKAISRQGDPDVYADVKFKQNVHVFVFNCRSEDLDIRYDSLVRTFAGDELYGVDE